MILYGIGRLSDRWFLIIEAVSRENMDNIQNVAKLSKKPVSNIIKIIIPMVAVVAAGVIGLIVYAFSPSARISRILKTAEKYLSEQNYEQAIAEFEHAIAIDERCTKAYIGMLTAYDGLDDENIGEYYEEVLRIISGWDADYIDRVEDDIVVIIEDAKMVCPDDLTKQFDSFEVGMGLVESEKIRELFVKTGTELIEDSFQNEEYEAAIRIVDRLLVYDDSDTVVDSLIVLLKKYIDVLINEQKYDRALELIDKYAYLFKDDYFDILRNKITELKEYYTQTIYFLSEIAQNCQAMDYEEVYTLMQSNEYEEILKHTKEVGDIKAYETPYGYVGVYIMDSMRFGGSMVYYGGYDGELRSGHGEWLAYEDGNNYHASGEWSNDAPNGTQHVVEWNSSLNESVTYRILDGNTVEGLWDGEVLWQFDVSDESVFETFPVRFSQGKWNVISIEEDGDRIVCDSGYFGDGSTNRHMIIKEDDVNSVRGIVGFAKDE